MSKGKKIKAVELKAIDGLDVTVIVDPEHEFLMSTKNVAAGFGVIHSTINRHKIEHPDELIEGKHFFSSVSIPHRAAPGASIGTLWTKRGIVRLGFFIKSKQARLFRDWAEDLVISKMQGARVVKQAELPKKRTHNRLTPQRLVDIMADVCLIENGELRKSLTQKLLVK